MIARLPVIVCLAVAVAAAAELEQASDLRYARPDGWERTVDGASHMIVLVPPGRHASAALLQGQSYSGTAAQWHQELWTGVMSKLTPRGPVTQGQRGEFQTTSGSCNKADGSQAWICLYSFVEDGRAGGVLFFADSEAAYQNNIATVNRLVDGIALEPAGNPPAAASPSASLYALTPAPAAAAATTPGAASPDEAAAGVSADLVVSLPPGWTQKVDAKSKVIFMRPPDAKVTETSSDVEIVIMPAQDFDGTADEWHAAALKFAQRGCRLLEPVRKIAAGGLLVSSSHLVDAKGTEQRQVVYTARWGTRAQMFVFLATHDDAFTKDGPAADRAITQIAIPRAGNTAAAAGTAPDSGGLPALGMSASPGVAAADGGPPPAAADTPAAPPGASFQPPAVAAAVPTDLVVNPPPGWTTQQDPKNGTLYLKPPDSPSIDKAVLAVFPSMTFAGTAEQFHNQTLSTVVGQGRLLEPEHHGMAGGFLASDVHYVTPQGGQLRLIVYTARWGDRAQAVMFVTARDDLFRNNATAANAAVLGVTVPGAASGSQVSAGATTAPAGIPSASGPMAPPAAAFAAAGPNAGGTDAGDTMPVLEYTDPPNFWRGGAGGKSYAEYQGSDINFTLCVYPFREFQGDIRATFQQTLLRAWIDVMYREESVAGPPQFTTYKTSGADAVNGVKFLDARQQQHFRLLLIAGHWAAIVDMIAPTAFAWQKGFSSAVQLLDSMKVGRKAAPPSVANGPGPQGAALAGLFQAMKNKFVVNLMLGPGYGSPKLALHYFLFSADGRVFRCYDFPPGGSEAAARQFDFDGAERQDPGNTGRFAVRGNELYIKMGGPNADEITTTVTDPNTLQLDGVTYQRKF